MGGRPRSAHVRLIQYMYMGTMVGFHHLGSKKNTDVTTFLYLYFRKVQMIIEFTKGSVRTNGTVLDSAHVERRKPAEFMISKS